MSTKTKKYPYYRVQNIDQAKVVLGLFCAVQIERYSVEHNESLPEGSRTFEYPYYIVNTSKGLVFCESLENEKLLGCSLIQNQIIYKMSIPEDHVQYMQDSLNRRLKEVQRQIDRHEDELKNGLHGDKGIEWHTSARDENQQEKDHITILLQSIANSSYSY